MLFRLRLGKNDIEDGLEGAFCLAEELVVPVAGADDDVKMDGEDVEVLDRFGTGDDFDVVGPFAAGLLEEFKGDNTCRGEGV